jgi:glycosyltransferase involved in cell wall biosynthesis
MRICQVISGNIPVLETGERRWGALELVQSEYKKHLIALGHTCDIKWLNEVNSKNYDIIHIHVANLCIEAQKKGIPYIYSMHDHHSYYFGKGSSNYNEQLQAIKGSIFSICHAEYVVDFFDETDKLFFLPHGVDTKFYLPNLARYINPVQHKLLMCANNGLAGNQGFDRKGFRYGIEAAKALGLPITIVGADANREFFEIHSDLLNYQNLTVNSSNPTEDEKIKIFEEHSIFVHPSMLEYGHPNLTLLEAASMCIPMAATYSGTNKIEGLFRIEEITTENVVVAIRAIMEDYKSIMKKMIDVRKMYDWSNVVKTLEQMFLSVQDFNHYPSDLVREKYFQVYNQ